MLTPPAYRTGRLPVPLLPLGMRDFVSGGVSRLDAFSVYLVRTELPSYALGRTTGAPEVRPSRSSRTKDSSLQISYAHGR